MSRESRRSRQDEATRRTREVAARAVRRLEWVEWMLLGGAAIVAIVGGALLSALFAAPLGVPFGALWVGISVVMLAVPGGLALHRARLEEREGRSSTMNETDEADV